MSGQANQSDYFGNERTEVGRLIPAGCQRVLEIGCGKGAFRRNFATVSEYVGVEPVASAASVAASLLDTVHVGTFDQVAARLPRNHFDLVVCNDVIEHMADHDSFLEAIKEHISANGRLLGSIPNVRYHRTMLDLVFRKDWQYADWGILDRTHLRFFTERSWRRTLASHGYELEVLKGMHELPSHPDLLRRTALRAWSALLGQDSRFTQFAFLAHCRR